jgi:hypothetical protein
MSILDFMEEEKPKPSRKKKVIEPEDVEMKKFTCNSCGKENFDMNLYFYDKPSTKCLWCMKFPVKEKKVIKKETK